MSKMSNLDSILKELRRKAKDIEELADAVEGMFSGTEEEKPAKSPKQKPLFDVKPKKEEPAQEISLSDIKEILMEKSRAGFDAEVHDLITSYGVKKLSLIDPSSYPELKAKAEVIGNG